MAPPLVLPTREEIQSALDNVVADDRGPVLREWLTAHYPDLTGRTIVRNRKTFDVVDYILDDLNSYG